MTLKDITIVGGPLALATGADVGALEAELETRFPAGYREYVTTLGEGVMGGNFVRVYPPWRILQGDNNLHEWRERIDEYWFWDDGADVLKKERALECVIVADTMVGDEVIFHPSEPDWLYVLPRHQEVIYRVGPFGCAGMALFVRETH